MTTGTWARPAAPQAAHRAQGTAPLPASQAGKDQPLGVLTGLELIPPASCRWGPSAAWGLHPGVCVRRTQGPRELARKQTH